MGEPRPPPGAPVLLFLLSLASGGGGGGQPLAWIPRGTTLHAPKVKVAFAAPGLETRLHHPWLQRGMGRGACPAQQSLQKLLPLWDRLPVVQQFRTYGRLRRAVFLPRFAPTGTKRLAEKDGRTQEEASLLTRARPTFQEEKDSLKPADPAPRTLPDQPGHASEMPGHRSGAQTPPPSAAMEAGVAHEAGCRCPESQRAPVAARALEAGQGVLRVPTPRTEEAAWAASALTFLLVMLTLAVLYTRLHRKCRRGTSLYWMSSSEQGRETVAAVLKRRLLSRHRRAKRCRQPLQQSQTLLPGSSSDDSSSA